MKRHPFYVPTIQAAAAFLLALPAGFTASAAEAPKGLVLHYSFDQAEASNAVIDRSGLNHNGRAEGPKWVSTGKQGGGCEFSKGNSIRVPNREALNPKQATWAAWFKTSKAEPSWHCILDKHPEQGYRLGIGDARDAQAKGKLAAVVNGGKPCLSDGVVADGAWHHAAATFDGENLRLYVDGQPQKQVVPCRARIAVNPADLVLGAVRSNNKPQELDASFEGMLDEIMIFDRALSADEIKTLFAAADSPAAKPKFTKQQVTGRLRQLKLLRDEGLLTEEFYKRKVEECEAAQ